MGADAAFRGGFIDYVNENYADAASISGTDGLARSETDDQKQRLHFWQGKSLLKDGSKDAAETLLEQPRHDGRGRLLRHPRRQPPQGRRKAAEMKRNQDQTSTRRFDWPAAEAWLTQKAGRPVGESGWIDGQALAAGPGALAGRPYQPG